MLGANVDIKSQEPQQQQQQQQEQDPDLRQEAITNLNIREVMDDFALEQRNNLDEKEFFKIVAKEDLMSDEQLSHVEKPIDLYPNIKTFLDIKIKGGVENFSSARAITRVNTFVTNRMNKIVISCVRHYDNKDMLEEQQSAMTPQELELSIKITAAIRDFRKIIY